MPQERLTADKMLDREFLNLRCRLLDIGAALDRIDRCHKAGTARRDPRYLQVRQALGLLAAGGPDRAEATQMLFSEPYEPDRPQA